MHVHLYVCMSVCVCIYVFTVYMYVCVCLYICIYSRVYIATKTSSVEPCRARSGPGPLQWYRLHCHKTSSVDPSPVRGARLYVLPFYSFLDE